MAELRFDQAAPDRWRVLARDGARLGVLWLTDVGWLFTPAGGRRAEFTAAELRAIAAELERLEGTDA